MRKTHSIIITASHFNTKRGWLSATYLLSSSHTHSLTHTLSRPEWLRYADARWKWYLHSETSRKWSYLQQNAVQLFVCWIGAESKPSERVVPVIAENRVHRLRSKPADFCTIIVRHLYDMFPAVVVDDCLESPGKSEVRPANTHHRVKSLRIVERWTTAPLREKRAIPEGHEISGRFTHCIQQQNILYLDCIIFRFTFVFYHGRPLVQNLSALSILLISTWLFTPVYHVNEWTK